MKHALSMKHVVKLGTSKYYHEGEIFFPSCDQGVNQEIWGLAQEIQWEQCCSLSFCCILNKKLELLLFFLGSFLIYLSIYIIVICKSTNSNFAFYVFDSSMYITLYFNRQISAVERIDMRMFLGYCSRQIVTKFQQ